MFWTWSQPIWMDSMGNMLSFYLENDIEFDEDNFSSNSEDNFQAKVRISKLYLLMAKRLRMKLSMMRNMADSHSRIDDSRFGDVLVLDTMCCTNDCRKPLTKQVEETRALYNRHNESSMPKELKRMAKFGSLTGCYKEMCYLGLHIDGGYDQVMKVVLEVISKMKDNVKGIDIGGVKEPILTDLGRRYGHR
ncbi:hypothetical protein ACH5RR_023080 [Cinchona calisaya]|uniref:Uncharacterized protein n=1 Tax=Cinchona calisaya TaxID=153742 RepID=A0ABD2Z9P6_9GENT